MHKEVDLSNYYQRAPVKQETGQAKRYPKNHVKYSSLLKPLQWMDQIYRLLGKRAFVTKDAMLSEFDGAVPLDAYLGTEQEIRQVRNQIVSICEGIDNNPFISPLGRFLIKKTTLDMLKNRKKVLRFYDSNKAFIESNGNFKSPLIITGASRTGTTLLQRLLSEDPNTRSPYTFELETPIPPMREGIDPMQDLRIPKSGVGIKTLLKLAPGFVEKFAESHVWSPIEMEESMIYSFTHNGLMIMNYPFAGKEKVHDLLKISNVRTIYRYEKLFFTTLDAYRPAKSHWTLKAPAYSTTFPLIFEEYQDANVIVTHRNPIITLPSLCRLWESWCIAFDKDGAFDKHKFGLLIKLIHEKYHSVPLNYRKTHPENERRIFDCMYEELFLDPISMVKKIYSKFDLEYTKEFEERMKGYLENNRQGKYGRHIYTLEEYGFDAERLYEDFKEYMKHYGFDIPNKIERPESFNFLQNYTNSGN